MNDATVRTTTIHPATDPQRVSPVGRVPASRRAEIVRRVVTERDAFAVDVAAFNSMI
jgi:hypothetical protein